MKLKIKEINGGNRWVMIQKLSMGSSSTPDFMADLVFAPFIEYELLSGKKEIVELQGVDSLELDGQKIWDRLDYLKWQENVVNKMMIKDLADCEEDGSCIPRYVQEGCED